MKNYTVVYHGKSGGYKAFHVVGATTEKLQKAFDEAEVQVIEHVIEQKREVGVHQFVVYATESRIDKFIEDWKLDY